VRSPLRTGIARRANGSLVSRRGRRRVIGAVAANLVRGLTRVGALEIPAPPKIFSQAEARPPPRLPELRLQLLRELREIDHHPLVPAGTDLLGPIERRTPCRRSCTRWIIVQSFPVDQAS
jgi:hypothetical protein